MKEKFIKVRGAATHNLQSLDVDIPRDQLVVITGVSGSGKSSLAFSTIYAEGKRRYVESLSAYARQFLSMIEKPEVDSIEGLSPAVSIEQKSVSRNPRSTVGTITEIYDYLRLLFARIGEARCPEHNIKLEAKTISSMVDTALDIKGEFMIIAPMIRNRKGEHQYLLQELRKDGFTDVIIDGVNCDINHIPQLDKNKQHTLEVVVDNLTAIEDNLHHLADSIEVATKISDGLVILRPSKSQDILLSTHFACTLCNYSLAEIEPRLFSFNNPSGACTACDGLGVVKFFDPKKIISKQHLTISEGAIPNWSRFDNQRFEIIQEVAALHDFDVDIPYKKLSNKAKDIILYGSDEELTPRQGRFGIITTFKGIIYHLERQSQKTSSSTVQASFNRLQTIKNCETCNGYRLRQEALNVLVDKKNIINICNMTIADCLSYFEQLSFTGNRQVIAEKILKEICSRLKFLNNVGLNYLSLSRSADTLSGGESQRIRLASQIGSGLVGVMYVLDEPSIGLHQRDNAKLLATLAHLRDIGNSVLVVEHDEETILAADFIVDIGPLAGAEGGEVVASGTVEDIKKCKRSITGQYLNNQRSILVPKKRVPTNKKKLTLKGCTGNNLKNVTLNLSTRQFICVTGVSGSGKSTLINQTLYPLAATALNNASVLSAAPCKDIQGLQHFTNCIDINQSPIGRTPRSNPATYTGLFTGIRNLFSQTQIARARGYKTGRFSFNTKGGRCEHCEGGGMIKIEMHFLPDMFVTCEQCRGSRYNRETLEIKYRGQNIAEILGMSIDEAAVFFQAHTLIYNKLKSLQQVGLGSMRLGQSATTLSGGEAQRIKLATELSKRSTGNTLYILDEPTTGLHFYDIQKLLDVLLDLRDKGNTIVVIEHNLSVIKCADWIVDMGPEGGAGGGTIIAEGTPEDVAKVAESFTGKFLKKMVK